jgi:hypothetical protein
LGEGLNKGFGFSFGFKQKNWNPTSGYGLGLQKRNSGFASSSGN